VDERTFQLKRDPNLLARLRARRENMARLSGPLKFLPAPEASSGFFFSPSPADWRRRRVSGGCPA